MGLTIVVGYDGSDCAKAALDQALGLAGPTGKVVITYADAPPRIGASSLVPPENIVALGRKVTAEAFQVARDVAYRPRRSSRTNVRRRRC